jgi:hypothetical protein
MTASPAKASVIAIAAPIQTTATTSACGWPVFIVEDHPESLTFIVAIDDQVGEPVIPNGLALCKLHHAAFDCLLLGITADLVVHLNRELLAERDGPMLEHGLRAFEGAKVVVPREVEDQPDRDLLAIRWKNFAA